MSVDAGKPAPSRGYSTALDTGWEAFIDLPVLSEFEGCSAAGPRGRCRLKPTPAR